MFEEEKKSFTKEIKECGLTNKQNSTNYNFPFVKKYCEENNICRFEKRVVRKSGRRLTCYKIVD